MKTAIMSYNTIVAGESNGWKGDILLIQNETGAHWGVKQMGGKNAGECVSKVSSLWDQLAEAIPEADKFYLYVGDRGAEHVISLAAHAGLTPEQAVFVLCDCNMSGKMSQINRSGFSSSEVIFCECGGHDTMNHIYRNLLREKAA